MQEDTSEPGAVATGFRRQTISTGENELSYKLDPVATAPGSDAARSHRLLREAEHKVSRSEVCLPQ